MFGKRKFDKKRTIDRRRNRNVLWKIEIILLYYNKKREARLNPIKWMKSGFLGILKEKCIIYPSFE